VLIRLMPMALIGLMAFGPASAQQYPDKPIKIVVGFTAGGIADLARGFWPITSPA